MLNDNQIANNKKSCSEGKTQTEEQIITDIDGMSVAPTDSIAEKFTMSELIEVIAELNIIENLFGIILIGKLFGIFAGMAFFIFVVTISKTGKELFGKNKEILSIVSIISSIVFCCNVWGVYSLDIYWDVLKESLPVIIILGVLNDLVTSKQIIKKLGKINFVPLVLSFIINLIIVLNIVNAFTVVEYVNSVRKAYFTQYSSSVTIEGAFDNFFEDASWDYFENKYEENIVEFEGEFYLNDRKTTANLQFILDDDTFFASTLTYNGVVQSSLELYSLLSAVYEHY